MGMYITPHTQTHRDTNKVTFHEALRDDVMRCTLSRPFSRLSEGFPTRRHKESVSCRSQSCASESDESFRGILQAVLGKYKKDAIHGVLAQLVLSTFNPSHKWSIEKPIKFWKLLKNPGLSILSETRKQSVENETKIPDFWVAVKPRNQGPDTLAGAFSVWPCGKQSSLEGCCGWFFHVSEKKHLKNLADLRDLGDARTNDPHGWFPGLGPTHLFVYSRVYQWMMSNTCSRLMLTIWNQMHGRTIMKSQDKA